MLNRRVFVGAITAAGALLAGKNHCSAAESPDQGREPDKRSRANPIAVSTYSYWRFRDDSKLSIERCIDEAARMGFDGVEILEMQMEDEDPGHLQKLKRQAFLNGLDLCGFSTHQSFLFPDADERQKNI